MPELAVWSIGRVVKSDPMPRDINQKPKQIARDRIDERIRATI